MIVLKNVSYRYKTGVIGIQDASLEIKDGEFVYIVGNNGAGKSTLMRLLNSELVPTKGTILVDGENVGKMKNRKVPKYRRKVGVIFQDFELLDYKTVFENVAYALEVVDWKKEDILKRVREVLKLVGLIDKSRAKIGDLSGGQQQRVAIARAFAGKPKIIIADEPTGNLDIEIAEEMMRALEAINAEGTTVLMVTHQAELIKKHPRRVISMESAHIANDMPVEIAKEVYKSYDAAKIDKEDLDFTAEYVMKKENIEKRVTDEFNMKTLTFEKPKGVENEVR